MLFQIVRAEWHRRWAVHRLSTFVSTFVFPATMVFVLFFLPGADLSGQQLDLLTVAYELPDELKKRPNVVQVLEDLKKQPLYSLEPSSQAVADYEAGKASAAILFKAKNSRSEVAVEVFRHNDLISNLILDRLQVDAKPERLIFSPQNEGELEEQEGRGHLARVGLFVLLGFAWFFVSAGVIERVVTERERRSLEGLLVIPIPAKTLVRGRLLEIVLHAAIPQVICGGALLFLGFSPMSLCLPLLILCMLYPLAFLCFALLYKTEDMLAAGWKTGVLFMFGFPILILLSDVLGTLSPAYQVARALEGSMAWDIYLPSLGIFALLSAVCWWACAWIAPKWQI